MKESPSFDDQQVLYCNDCPFFCTNTIRKRRILNSFFKLYFKNYFSNMFMSYSK